MSGEVIGTFFGVPVVVDEHLEVGERDLGLVLDCDEFATFLLDAGDGSEPKLVETDQAH